MPPRSPFRIVAPVALLVIVVAVLMVVKSGSSDSGSETAARTTVTEKSKQPKRRLYTVRQGDSLGKIANRYGITVERLTELNPKVDPQAIRAGQRLRLRG